MDENEKKSTTCEECENYKFAIMALHRQNILKLTRYVATLVFVATLSVFFHSYIPCAFLLLLLVT